MKVREGKGRGSMEVREAGIRRSTGGTVREGMGSGGSEWKDKQNEGKSVGR